MENAGFRKQPSVPDYDEVWSHIYGDMQHCGPVHRHLRRIVNQILGQLDYRSVLDVGCGMGHNLLLLSKERVLLRRAGIDISAVAIERARQVVDAEFWQIDIQKNTVESLWDLVLSSQVLEHLPDDVAALRNLRKMTGKYLLVTTMAGDFERYRAWEELMGHVRNYQQGELEQKLASTGFKVRKTIYWGFPFYSPMARKLQNLSKAGTGQLSASMRFLASVLYWLYYLNSHQRGDLLIVLAEV